MSERDAVFFISTGRCATQFFAKNLATHYNDLARVKHEPYHQEYEPRRYFSAYHRDGQAELTPVLQEHVDFINGVLKEKHYVETGWPVYGVLPLLFPRIEGRIKLVHLYRHPLNVAASLSTHLVYSRENWSEHVAIRPTDEGVLQGHLAGEAWEKMSDFEKCIFWWTEINHFALELHEKNPTIPWLSLKFEDVFHGDTEAEMRKLMDFLEFPAREELIASSAEKVDRVPWRAPTKLNLESLADYPAAIDVMKRLGYSYEERMFKDIKTRYQVSFLRALGGKGKRALLKIVGR